jgi:hypothetical protein
MEGDLGIETRQSLGESGGWYAKETPGGERGDIGAVATAWPELPEAIRAGIVAVVKAARS